MRVWRVSIGPETKEQFIDAGGLPAVIFHVAAEHSTDAAASARILYAAISGGPEEARSKISAGGYIFTITEVCKLDSICLDGNAPSKGITTENLAEIFNRIKPEDVMQMFEKLKTAILSTKEHG